MQDDKHRVKLSKEYQDFVIWVSKQDEFVFHALIGKWSSFSYADKSTIQLYIHFQKNVKTLYLNKI